MSIEALNWAWQQLATISSPSNRLVLLALADAANEDGECWPRLDVLAKKTGVSRSRVSRAVHTMEEEGLLIVGRRGQGKANTYTLSVAHWATQTDISVANMATQEPVSVAHPATQSEGELPNGQLLSCQMGNSYIEPKENPKESTSKQISHQGADTPEGVSFAGQESENETEPSETGAEGASAPAKPAETAEGTPEPAALVPGRPGPLGLATWLPAYALDALTPDAVGRLEAKWLGARTANGWTPHMAAAVWETNHPDKRMPRGLSNPTGWVVAQVTRQLSQTPPATPPVPAKRAAAMTAEERNLAYAQQRQARLEQQAQWEAEHTPLSECDEATQQAIALIKAKLRGDPLPEGVAVAGCRPDETGADIEALMCEVPDWASEGLTEAHESLDDGTPGGDAA